MNTRNLSRRIQIVAGLLTVSCLSACITPLTEEEQFAREYARAEREESIRTFIVSCEAGGNAVVYTGGSYHKLRDPVKHIPGNARLSEYQCVTAAALNRGMGIGG